MTTTRKKIIGTGLVVAILATLALTLAWAEDPPDQDGMRNKRKGPPPEAFEVCEGKSVGDAAELTTPRGDTLTGTCQEMDGRLVLRPDNMPERGGEDGQEPPRGIGTDDEGDRSRRHGPPPQAYEACEGKNAGDAVEVTLPDGKTLTGTCEERDDGLAMRPDNMPENGMGPKGGGHHGPPAEAFEVCEGKSAGDAADLTTPRGDTLTGTCQDMDGRLVLRPDNMPDKRQGPPPSMDEDKQ